MNSIQNTEVNQNEPNNDSALTVDIQKIDHWGIPNRKTRKQWYQATNPQIRSYITGNLTASISGKGARSLKRAADEYQYLSEDLARHNYSSKAMSEKYDNFNGIDFSILDKALENEHTQLDTHQQQFNTGQLSERKFNRLQRKHRRRINNLNENYQILSEVWHNKRGIPLVRTQSSVSSAPFLLGTIGLPAATIGLISGGTAAAPYIGKALANPWVQRGLTGVDIIDTGASLLNGNYLSAAANWVPYDKILKYGKQVINKGGDLIKQGVTKAADKLKPAGKQVTNTVEEFIPTVEVENVPADYQVGDYEAFIIDNEGNVVREPSKLTYPHTEQIISAKNKVGDTTIKPPYNPNSTIRNLGEIGKWEYVTPYSNPRPVDQTLTDNFISYINSTSSSDLPHTHVNLTDARRFYANTGIDPNVLSEEVVRKAASIAQKSALETVKTVPEGVLATTLGPSTGYSYFNDGKRAGYFTTSLYRYGQANDGVSPMFAAQHSNIIGKDDVSKRGVSEQLYNAAIQLGSQRFNTPFVVSGEDLISPEATTAVWNKFNNKMFLGNIGGHSYGIGAQLVPQYRKPMWIVDPNSSRLKYRYGYEISNGPVMALTKPTKDVPVKVDNLLHPDRIVPDGNGGFSLKPLNMKSKNLYKSIVPIVGTGTGLYFISGNSNNSQNAN
ncbi:MAG: hypothetical protein U0L85_03980 [Bacilli bacterium]|nr:hypothetical protein [Bacilli bacterium]